MSLIAAQGLTVRLGGATILDRVDLEVIPGEIVTVVGPNGSGKSTLLKALIGAVPVASGRITRAAGLTIGYVPQRLHIDPSLPITVARFLGLPDPAPARAVDAALAEAGAAGLGARQLIHLSGGQLQRVLLARALIGRPRLLILDEPTQGLDQPASAGFYEAIERARASLGCGVLLVSHDLHVVMSASDRVICLNTHVCCEGRPEMVADAPAYRALFGEGTRGTLALYRHHHHGHTHDGPHGGRTHDGADSGPHNGPGSGPHDDPDPGPGSGPGSGPHHGPDDGHTHAHGGRGYDHRPGGHPDHADGRPRTGAATR